MKRVFFAALLLLTMIAACGMAQPVIPPDEFPAYGSSWNLNNTGLMFTDGEYFYVNANDGRLYRLDDQLQLDRSVLDDSVKGISRMTYMEDEQTLYFLADRIGKDKTGGLCKVRLRGGFADGPIECLVKGVVANYAINEDYICYQVDGYKGVYRIDHDGEGRFRLSRHQVQKKNPAVRMHIDGDTLYYINLDDHYLWSVPVNARTENEARVFINRPMHYYIVAPYVRRGAKTAEEIFIYVEYAKNTAALDKAHLAAVDRFGERIAELDFLRDIQTRYINYHQGVLYYVDNTVTPQMPRWIRLDGTAQGGIYVEGQGDLKAFRASDGTHWKFNDRIGYIHIFDGWAAMKELGENFVYTNPRTGRSDVTGGAGSDIWFINLETLESYRCHLPD